jgi:hypothetical protein
VDPNGLYELDTCQVNGAACTQKQFQRFAKDLRSQLAKLTNAANKMKDSTEKARLQASLKAIGTEGDGNDVKISFGATKGGGAGEVDPIYDQNTNTYSGFNLTLDTTKLRSSDDFAIAGAHEGTHVDDYKKYMLNMQTMMHPFQLEYRAYQTSAWAASALGYSSFTTQGNGRKFTFWNASWGAVDDQILTDFIKTFKDRSGQPTHPEVIPHNPLPN